MERVEILRNRRERLIELNLIHGYTQSNNPRISQYYRCILHVRKQINKEECATISQGFLHPQNALTLKHLYALTSPRALRVKKIIADPAFDKPIANLYKEYSQK